MTNRGTALFTIMYLLPCNYCEVRCSHLQHHLIHIYQPFFHERNFPLMFRVFQKNMFKFNPDGWLTYIQVGGSLENQFRRSKTVSGTKATDHLRKDPSWWFFVCVTKFWTLTVPKKSSEM